jgi:plastocyanin
METSLTQPTVRHRAPLSALTKLTIAALVGFAGLIVYGQAILFGRFDPTETVFAVVLLAVAGGIASGWRWAPLLGALLSALMIGSAPAIIIHDLTHPEAFHVFVTVLLVVALALVGIVAGISATIQNYRGRERRTPRIMVPALATLTGLCLGAILVAAIPREAGTGVSAAVLAGLPAMITPDFRFEQTELRAKVGDMVALRLDNTHTAPHSFDVDELNVHVPAAPGAQGLILFMPTTPGTYTYYCAIPGHRELGMEGTLIVAP